MLSKISLDPKHEISPFKTPSAFAEEINGLLEYTEKTEKEEKPKVNNEIEVIKKQKIEQRKQRDNELKLINEIKQREQKKLQIDFDKNIQEQQIKEKEIVNRNEIEKDDHLLQTQALKIAQKEEELREKFRMKNQIETEIDNTIFKGKVQAVKLQLMKEINDNVENKDIPPKQENKGNKSSFKYDNYKSIFDNQTTNYMNDPPPIPRDTIMNYDKATKVERSNQNHVYLRRVYKKF